MLDRHAPGHPLHLVQHSRIGTLCFSREEDWRHYLTLLKGAAQTTGCAIHAYVLMANHVHLLLTPAMAGATTRLLETMASGPQATSEDARAGVRSRCTWFAMRT